MTDLFEKRKPKKINPLRLKASDIRTAMSKRWTSPEWAIMWEVGQGTGSNSGRYADAVMMSLWPSRGLELHGVEIKISRADWKREAADPTKAEAIARFCDRWWIHTPEGVVDDLSDLPPAWGLREWTGKQWRTVREAEKTECDSIDRAFLAALLRRADGLMQGFIDEAISEARAAAWAEAERQRAEVNDRVKREVAARTQRINTIKESLVEFEQTFGERSLSEWGIDRAILGRAARLVHDCRFQGHHEKGLPERLRKAASAIEEVQALVEGST